MVQHPLKHGGVTLLRHALEGVLEVAVIPGEEHRHPGGGVGVDRLRLLSPLLHGVVDKHVLVHIVGQSGDLGVSVLPQLENGHLLLRAVLGQQLVPQALALLGTKGGLQGGEVEGDRVGHAAPGIVGDVGDDPVLVVPPGSKPGQPVKDPLVVGVEDMGAVLVNEHAGLVQTVVGVAADMVPALQNQHPLAALLCQLPGAHRPGITRADHQRVKGTLQLVSRLFFIIRPDRLSCPDRISIP